MVTPVEVGLVVLVLALLAGAYLLLRAVKPLIVNTFVGLVVLFLASLVGYGVALDAIVILVVAFGGLPAAILVIVLAQLGVVFEPAMILPPF